MKQNLNDRLGRYLMWGLLLFAGSLLCSSALAYEFYSDAIDDQGQCAQCHTGFRQDSNYVSQAEGGEAWGTSLHNAHLNNTNIESSCDNCHGGAGTSGRMVNLHSSAATPDGTNAVGCMGCHGRLEDANTVTENGTGWGAGLRQKHNGAGVTLCLPCHADSVPANFTPVGEDTPPPWYASVTNTSTGTTMEPCNMIDTEFLEGLTIGLDNDGDGVYDMNDTDCSGVSATPGETSGQTMQALLVSAHDAGAGTLTLSFENGCSATDNNLEWGPLSGVATYAYSLQTSDECALGTGGSYVWAYPVSIDSIFFLMVGNDGNAEGSLGLDSLGAERPEHVDPGGVCDVNQALADRCD